MIVARDRILFQGDSITDAGRDRAAKAPNSAHFLGNGYPALVAARLLRDRAGDELVIENRGISGNRVPDLHARWQKETLDLRPSVLSILIGVNDIWHKLNGNYEGTVADYEEGLHDLLDWTRRELPEVRLVICEPFVLRCGAVGDRWFPEFDERRAAARRQAETFAATLVPFQTVFDRALKEAPAAYWAADGVHPTLAGHQLMADAWLSATSD